MKRLAAASVLAFVGIVGACTVAEPETVGDQGASGSGAVPGGGSGGAGAQGGTGVSGSAPTSGSGGTVAPTGGTAGSGVGGTPPMGGQSGGPAGGTGGSGNEGGVGNTGGMSGAGNTGGMSGAGNTGGMSGAGNTGGMSGAGNTGGSGGGGAGGTGNTCPTPAQLFPVAQVTGQNSGLTGNANPAGAMGSFDGYQITTPCSPTECDDCGGNGWYYKGTRVACNAGGVTGLNAVQNFTVGGTPGMSYRVTINIYGIMEPKNYGNAVTRQSGTTRPMNQDSGANPPPWAYATGNPTYRESDYNTYEIHVVDNNGMDVCSYYLNSDTSEGHWTYVANYSRTINVIGGGRIRVRVYDRNCRMIKNCMTSALGQANCDQGRNGECANRTRTVNIPATADPQPMGLTQPGLGQSNEEAGQWMFLDVTNVVCGMPALGCNGM